MKLLPVGIISLPFYNNNKKKDIKEKQEKIQAWIKGISRNNGNKWSFLYTNIDNKETVSMYGEEKSSDENRIVLIALLELMEWIYNKDKKKILIVYTNSSYVVNCISDWSDRWRRTNYKRKIEKIEINEKIKKIEINEKIKINEFKHNSIECGIEIQTVDRPNADVLRRIDKLKSHVNITVKRLMIENEYSIMTNDLIDK
jgi:ribonuclease HI